MIIPADAKFEKVYAKKGQQLCKIQDEIEFREQAGVFLKEYFEEFEKGIDAHEFCQNANIEEIRQVLTSF